MTPFQISTLPEFTCGGNIQLVLTVNSSAGDFASKLTLPTACCVGGGACLTCVAAITNTIGAGDLTLNERLARNVGTVAKCGENYECPGPFADPGTRFDVYRFTNSSASAVCHAAYLANPCGNLFLSAYLGILHTNDLCDDYLADAQDSGAFLTINFTVPPGRTFSLVVNDIPSEGPGCDYRLILLGPDCVPALNIASVPGNNVRLSWPTSAGGYLLDGTPGLTPTNWSAVPQAPVVSDALFNVTNPAAGPHRFYRLRKPE